MQVGVVKLGMSGAGMCASGCGQSVCEWCRYVCKSVSSCGVLQVCVQVVMIKMCCVQVGVVKVGVSGAGMCASGCDKSGSDKSGCEWCRYVCKWVWSKCV